MSMRSNTTDAARRSQTGMSRATIRKVDDNHLIQRIEMADVYYSESPSDFERPQSLGITAVPLDQDEEQQQQGQQGQQAAKPGEFNDKQPKGPSAETVMNYMNGSRSHPLASTLDDRRVRPYDMDPGMGAFYSPDGSGQMMLHKKDGVYLLTCDGKAYSGKQGAQQQDQERFVSLRHVEKPLQDRKPKSRKQQQGEGPQALAEEERYKHEGKSVNTEVRCTKGRIEFRSGDTVVGYYDKGADTWFFKGKVATFEVETRFETVGKTYLGLDSKGEQGPKVATEAGPAKQTWAKAGG